MRPPAPPRRIQRIKIRVAEQLPPSLPQRRQEPLRVEQIAHHHPDIKNRTLTISRTAHPTIIRDHNPQHQDPHPDFPTTLLGETLLREVPPGTWFEINAANLTTGTRFRFTQDLVGDYITGSTPSSQLKLRVADAVAWSCAVPGAFNSTVLRTLPLPCMQRAGYPELVDGGVYDNLGADALKKRPEMQHLFCIVVNAGGSFEPAPSIGGLPVIGDLWRANGVLYQQVASVRSRYLFDSFASSGPAEMDGCLFNLRSPSPANVPPANNDVLSEFVEMNPGDNQERIATMASFPTTLGQVDPAMAQGLIYRGWQLAGATLSAYAPEFIDAVPRYEAPALN